MADVKQDAARWDVRFEQGDDFVFDIIIEDDAGSAIDFNAHSDEELALYRIL